MAGKSGFGAKTKAKIAAGAAIPAAAIPAAVKRRRFLVTSQIMTRWSIARMTVIRLIEEGALTGVKIRRQYRVDVASVEAYENANRF